jgi:hypothetical protein
MRNPRQASRRTPSCSAFALNATPFTTAHHSEGPGCCCAAETSRLRSATVFVVSFRILGAICKSTPAHRSGMNHVPLTLRFNHIDGRGGCRRFNALCRGEKNATVTQRHLWLVDKIFGQCCGNVPAGSTKLSMVRNLLERKFPGKVNTQIEPDLCVARCRADGQADRAGNDQEGGISLSPRQSSRLRRSRD